MVMLIAHFIPVIRYRQKKHLVDVTEIFNMLAWEKKQRLVKLFYLVLTLFFSVFWYEKAQLSVNVMTSIKVYGFILKCLVSCRMIYTTLEDHNE